MDANLWLGTALFAALGVWLIFVALYFAYGNRLRAPAARALMIMALGYAIGLVPTLLRHPFGITTDHSETFAWFQFATIVAGAAGTAWMTILMGRANHRWPWHKKDKLTHGHRAEGEAQGRPAGRH